MRKGAKKGQSAIDILEINKLRRQLLLQSYVWDRRLVSAASMGNASPLGHSASNLRGREKVNSTEKPLELTEKPVDHEGGSRDLPCANLRVVDSEVRDAETDNNRGKQSQRILPYGSADFGDQLGPAALSAGVVRRAHSEGQFSTVIANLSDSLDAKWTGENGSAPAATAAAASEAGTAASSVTSETATEVLSDDRGVPDMADRDASWEDQRAEDVSKWIRVPFTGLYQSFNKVNSVGGGGGGALGLHSLGDYSPIFIPSFVELERHGGSGLLMPVGVNDTVVPVYDDEPTSIISYALVSPEYLSQMADDRERVADGGDPLTSSLPSYDSGSYHPFRSLDEISSEYFSGSVAAMDEGARSTLALDPLLYTKALHIRVSFADEGPRGKVKYTVTCYYAKRFEALRRTCCPSELDFVRSLSRCKKWGAQGGKSNVFFAKSLDERFIIKQVTKTELESFIKFAPEYFKYLSESISTGSPTCLAKILGIYQVWFETLSSPRPSSSLLHHIFVFPAEVADGGGVVSGGDQAAEGGEGDEDGRAGDGELAVRAERRAAVRPQGVVAVEVQRGFEREQQGTPRPESHRVDADFSDFCGEQGEEAPRAGRLERHRLPCGE